MVQVFIIASSLLLSQTGQIAAFSTDLSTARRHDNVRANPSKGSSSSSSSSSSLAAVREATFGMGCFWEPAESLLKQPGILATTVGYTGAPPNKPPPTYDSVCFGKDWVEGVRVAYDDELVSYGQVLDYFFEYQNPKPGYRQYASIIFTNDANEEQEANQWKKASVGKQSKSNFPSEIVEIEESSPFYKAEEYHQRYWEKQRLRLLIGLAMIAGESGAYDKYLVGAFGEQEIFGLSYDSMFGAVFLVGAAWTLLERLVTNGMVQEMKEGDMMAMAE